MIRKIVSGICDKKKNIILYAWIIVRTSNGFQMILKKNKFYIFLLFATFLF